MLPFKEPHNDRQFRSDTTFDDVLQLYIFDRELRLLVTDSIERIEVAIRAGISNHMATHAPGGAFWYLRSQNFTGRNGLEDIRAVLNRQTEEAIRRRGTHDEVADPWHYPDALSHYVATYDSPRTPPSWLAVELLTLGELRRLYKALPEQHRKTVAQNLGLQEPLLQSWFRSFVRVRNICAHHGRLWNRLLGVYPAIPRSRHVRWLADNRVFGQGDSRTVSRKRLYPVLVAIQTILFTISPRSSWATRLRGLLHRYPTVPLISMGIDASWESDLFWQDAFNRHREHDPVGAVSRAMTQRADGVGPAGP